MAAFELRIDKRFADAERRAEERERRLMNRLMNRMIAVVGVATTILGVLIAVFGLIG